MLSFVANFPRGVLGTRANPDTSRIRAGKGKIWILVDVEILESATGKSLRIKKYSDTYNPSMLEIESAMYVRKEK